jgi:hypothetical protein
MSTTEVNRFISPYDDPAPEGAEGWEELYPYYLHFREDRREFEDSRFWFADLQHHDTRPHALSRNDELVKDADVLWRFSVAEIGIGCDWWGITPAQYDELVEQQIVERLFTETAREIARAELADTRRILCVAQLADGVATR